MAYSFSSSAPVQNPGAVGMYNSLLGLNQQNYQNILSGYTNAQGNLGGQLNSIYGGYGNVQSNVLKTLGVQGGGWGVAAPAAAQIAAGFQKTQGATDSALASAGLGNTTVRGSLQNQNALQAGQAYGALGSQLAQTAAGYESQIGLAGLGARMQGTGMQSGLAQSYLGDLAGYRFANTFGNLYGQASNSGSNSGGGGGGGGGYGGYGSSSDAFTNNLLNGNPLAGSGYNGMGYAGGYTGGSYGSGGGIYYGQNLNLGADQNGDLPTQEQADSNNWDYE